MKKFIICDIDGTIADLTHRLHYIKPDEGRKKNWYEFHMRCIDDKPHHDMHFILWTLVRADKSVIYVSGRSDVSRAATENWLAAYGFPLGQLHMRKNGDFRSDDVIKEEILDTKLKLTPADVLCVLDDRQRVVDMWRRRGFRVLQVAAGDF
jgi:hypothetical protein